MKTSRIFSAVILSLLLLLATAACGEKVKPTLDDLKYKTPLTYRIYPEVGSNVGASEISHYDKNGYFTGRESYTFDKFGRLSSGRNLTDLENNNQLRRYEYDEDGKLTGVFYTDSINNMFDKNILLNAEYDNDLRLTVITTSFGGERFRYDENGRLVKHSVIAGQDSVVTNFEYSGEPLALSRKSVRNGRDLYVYNISSDGFITSVDKKRYNKRYSRLNDIDRLTYVYNDLEADGRNWTSATIADSRNRTVGSLVNDYSLASSDGAPRPDTPAGDAVLAMDSTLNSNDVNITDANPTALASVMTAYTPASDGNFLTNYFTDAVARFNLVSVMTHSPGPTLIIILAVLTIAYCVLALYWMNGAFYDDDMFDYWWGSRDSNGMKRLWMFSPNPYTRFLALFGALIASFVAAVLTVMLVGVVVWLLLWAVKLLLIVLVWAGWAALIFGILAVFGGEIIVGIILAIIGGAIVGNSDEIAAFGNQIVDWGFDFMGSLNFYDWILGIFQYLWDVILAILFSPVALFLTVAAVIISIVLLLMGTEWVVMRFYNIRRPCPTCGCTDDFVYLPDGVHPHPVALHPGIYGVFTQRDGNGHSVPTMIFNGKGRIKRKCRHCNSIEHNAGTHTVGTEKHIGIVGNRSSGKTYFLYSALSHLLSDTIKQTDVTPNTDINAMARRIGMGQGVQTQVSNLYKATQIMAPRSGSPVPWHLFFYDVAGENFDTQAVRSASALRFYKNVEMIVFVIDPTQIDLNRTPTASVEARKWIAAHQAPADERVSPESTFSRLSSILQENGRDPRKIDVVFLLTKHDLGYMPAGVRTEEYVRHHLGQDNLVNTACNTFRSVSFCATSVKGTGIRGIMKSILRIIGVEL